MKKIIIALILFLTAMPALAQDQGAIPNPGPALIMFYHNDCVPCKKLFVSRATALYAKTEAAKKFPLLIIHIMAPMPQWLINAFAYGKIKREARFPILIKWDGEKEIGRLTKLPGVK